MRLLTRLLLLLLLSLQFCDFAKAAVVEGYIYLGKDGPPAANVPVQIAYRPHWDRYTDKSGFFRFENVEKGKWVVLSRPDGYRPARQELDVPAEENDTLRVILYLKKEGKRLLDEKVDAQVVVHVVGGKHGEVMTYLPVIASGTVTRSVSTDNVGRALFRNLPPGEYTFKASHNNYGHDSETLYVPPGNVNLDVYLRLSVPKTEKKD